MTVKNRRKIRNLGHAHTNRDGTPGEVEGGQGAENGGSEVEDQAHRRAAELHRERQGPEMGGAMVAIPPEEPGSVPRWMAHIYEPRHGTPDPATPSHFIGACPSEQLAGCSSEALLLGA